VFEEGGVATAAPAAEVASTEQPTSAEDIIMSPAARKLAEENGISANDVAATGKDGRVTKEDILNHLKAPKAEETPAAAPANAPAPAAAKPAVNAGAISFDAGDRVEKRVPMTRLRSTIAKRLVSAQQNAAMLTTYNEVNMKPIMELRKKYQDRFVKAHGVKLGFMSFFVKAATEALKKFPAVNASIDGNDMIYHGYQDVGVAVSTERGLVVPILRDTDNMGLAEVESTIGDFGARARDGKLGIDEMQGGTFTISNGGTFGSLLSTPILNPPQTAIMGMHKIQDRPMAVDGEVVILPMMYLALSYDHRMIDGKEAVQFLVAIKDMLEDPARLLLDI
jgi:2-oxoglutarate dehydrogenase E2 component (dihydrolipoamide succinyltransferase)